MYIFQYLHVNAKELMNRAQFYSNVHTENIENNAHERKSRSPCGVSISLEEEMIREPYKAKKLPVEGARG